MPYTALHIIVAFIIAAILTRISIPVVLRLSKLKNLYDEPNARKVNTTGVPTLGGIGIFIGFTLSIIFASYQYIFSEVQYIIGASIILFFIGLKDDLLVIAPHKKLLAQLAAAVVLFIFADIRFTHLHGLFGIEALGIIPSFFFTLFVIIGIINAFNLIDGIDGLAAGVGIIISLVFGGWFLVTEHWSYALMAIALSGTLFVFIYYNVFSKHNKIFMGDTGSLLLGLIFAIFVIQFNEFNIVQTSPYSVNAAPAVSFGILIIPLFDTCRVFILRLLRKQSPFSPDKNHIHHKLLQLGYNHIQASTRMLACNIGFIALNFILQGIGTVSLLLLNLTLALVLTIIPVYLILIKRRKERELTFQDFLQSQVVLFKQPSPKSTCNFSRDLNKKEPLEEHAN